MRTPRDEYTPRGRCRIYSRDLLLNSENVPLHTTGQWYVEPSNWIDPQPRQHGYDTHHEAREEAEAIERLWLEAEAK